MSISKCHYCGKPFNGIGSRLCAQCMQLLDDAYVKARKYIYQNPEKAGFSLIVEDTGIPEKALSYLVDQGRLLVHDKTGGGSRCRACGTETSGGVLCEHCKRKLISEKLISGTDKKEKTDRKTAGMRVQPLSHGPR